MKKINLKKLADFLAGANRSTYANKDAPKTKSTRFASDDYEFKKGPWIYHDTYFGGRDFMGEEIIYLNKIPVWGANYYGFILNQRIRESDLYGFLRHALLVREDIIPVRGPKSYKEDIWKYINVVYGKLDRFIGEEKIFKKGKLVYRAFYHGGFIS